MTLTLLKSVLVKKNPNRQRLREAIANRDAASLAIDAAQAVVDRVQTVIDAGRYAADLASKLDADAKAALAAWIKNYCRPENAEEHQKLRAAADEAQQNATRAHAVAEAARNSIGRTESKVINAQVDLKAREDEITKAIGPILVAEIAPALQHLERVAEEYRAAEIEVRGLHRMFWKIEHSSPAACQVIDATVKRAAIKQLPDLELNNYGKPCSQPPEKVMERYDVWVARAAALRVDPDA